jgi:hypothetical protein
MFAISHRLNLYEEAALPLEELRLVNKPLSLAKVADDPTYRPGVNVIPEDVETVIPITNRKGTPLSSGADGTERTAGPPPLRENAVSVVPGLDSVAI